MEDRPDEMSVVENLRAHGLIIDGKDIQIPADHFRLKTWAKVDYLVRYHKYGWRRVSHVSTAKRQKR